MSTKKTTAPTPTPRARSNFRRVRRAAFMSKNELAQLGDGKIAYIKELTSDEAIQFYPSVENLPKGLMLYALHSADGTPIALTDDRGTAIAHAMGDQLEIATIH